MLLKRRRGSQESVGQWVSDSRHFNEEPVFFIKVRSRIRICVNLKFGFGSASKGNPFSETHTNHTRTVEYPAITLRDRSRSIAS
jgi:hypothetical protein